MEFATYTTITFGTIVALYGYYVELRAASGNDYVAMCDISPEISCSKVVKSEYGKVFSHLKIVPKDSLLDQPNALYGAVFYICFGLLYYFWGKNAQVQLILLGLTVSSMLLSVYLAYILTEVLKLKCIICYSIYLCNFVLFVIFAKLAFGRGNLNKSEPLKKKKLEQ